MGVIEKTKIHMHPHEQISCEIEKIVGTKNPFSILFSFGRIAETLTKIDDELIDGIERSFVDSTEDTYRGLLSDYKKDGVFTYLSSRAIGTGDVKKYRRNIDAYFEASFSCDLDFFFLTLRQDRAWGAAMIMLMKFLKNKNLFLAFSEITDADAKRQFLLNTYTPARNFPEGIQRESTVILGYLCEGGLPEIPQNGEELNEQDEHLASSIVRTIALEAFTKDPAGRKSKFFIDIARRASVPGHRIVEHFPDNAILRLMTALRRGGKLISMAEKSDYWQNDRKVENFAKMASAQLPKAHNPHCALAMEAYFQRYHVNRDFFLAKFRYKYMAQKFPELLDMVFGIPALAREEWNTIRKKMEGSVKDSDFSVLRQVKSLIIYLQNNFITNLVLPFFLRKLATQFHARIPSYWLVKFVLLLVLSESYSEYKEMLSFYGKLEAHWKAGWRGVGLRLVQFGWVFIALAIGMFIFPGGVVFAAIAIALGNLLENFIEKKYPLLYQNLNFQFQSFAVIIALFSITLGASIGLGDNLNLVYKNFKTTINALTLPAQESILVLERHLQNLTSDITGAQKNTPHNLAEETLLDVDYSTNTTLRSLREDAQQNMLASLSGVTSSTATTIAPAQKTPVKNTEPSKNTGFFVVQPGATFWDNAVQIRENCQKEVRTKEDERFVYFALQKYLTSLRDRLTQLARIPKNSRMPVMEMVKYLPSGTEWEQEKLASYLCQ